MTGHVCAPTAPHLHALFSGGRSDAEPVCHDGRRLVLWGEFAAQVGGLAARLRQRDETRWLLAADDPLRFFAGLLALLYAGKQVIVPPNTLPGTLASLADVFDSRIDDSDLVIAGRPALAKNPLAIDPRAAIIDLYTSGSTGGHKRVRKTLAQFAAEVAVLEALWGAKIGRAAMIATAPHQHIYGLLFRLFWPLATGRVFDALTCAHPDTLEQRLAHFGRAVLISSPAQLTRLPELLALPTLTPKPVAVFSSGGPLPASAARALREGLGQAPFEVFGSTETGGVAWRQQHDEHGGDWWTPFPGHCVSRSAEGALTLVSPFLPNAEPLVMDDGVELCADGRFRLLGRLDRVVKIEEKRLSLPEMEAYLANHVWVDEAAVVALSGRRQSIGAVLVLNGAGRSRLASAGKRPVTQELHRHLAGRFEAVLLPRYWRFPDRLPLSARGKLAHAALADLFASSRSPAPSSANAQRMLPEVTAVVVERDGERWRAVLDLHVAPQIAHFSGHFPGAALLPGVVQVDWAVHYARRHLPVDGVFSALENLKFLGVVVPDTRLRLSLVWDAARRSLEFCYAASERKYSAGRVVFGATP